MSDADHQRIEAAAEKRRRKLARYTDTPAARAQRAITEARHDAGEPIPTPERYPIEDDVTGQNE